MDYKGTKESKLQEAIKGIKKGCNDQFYKKDEGKIEGLVEEITFVRQELEKDQLAILNKMLDRGKRRKQFESFVSKADLNTGVYKTKTSENQRYITPPLVLTNSHNSISQFSTPCIKQRLTSIIQGINEFTENETFQEIRPKLLPFLMTFVFAISEKITIHFE